MCDHTSAALVGDVQGAVSPEQTSDVGLERRVLDGTGRGWPGGVIGGGSDREGLADRPDSEDGPLLVDAAGRVEDRRSGSALLPNRVAQLDPCASFAGPEARPACGSRTTHSWSTSNQAGTGGRLPGFRQMRTQDEPPVGAAAVTAAPCGDQRCYDLDIEYGSGLRSPSVADARRAQLPADFAGRGSVSLMADRMP
jgi:hypothetical protein